MTDLSDLPLGVNDKAGSAGIRFEQLSHRYRSAQGDVDALVDIDFEIAAGEIFGVIGRSGAGKSTLVRTINMLEKPSAGRVLVNGADLSQLGERALAQARRRIGMIFQHFNLLSSCTVAQNIGLPLRIAGVPAGQTRQKVDSLLELVGLSDKRDVYPARLSGGQKQRAGIARALVHDPEILLCDEATSALDPETTESILQLLRDINRRLGLTVVLITHEMEVIRGACDRVAVMERGRVAEIGDVWRVFGAPQAEATRALLRVAEHELPADVRAQIASARRSPSDALLLEVRVDGHGSSEPDLVALVSTLAEPEIRLVHGAVERIQGRTQGRLVLAVPGAREGTLDVGAWTALPGWSGHRVRHLGYLNAGARHG
ncbi:MAG: ATP-binding cassette domain-containing protein [Noviherbaspirillum sp.]